MATYQQIIEAISEEILRLQKVRDLLVHTASAKDARHAKRHTMSPEGRARVAAAQKKRWAALRKAGK